MAKKDLKEKEKLKRDKTSKRISKFNKRMKDPVIMSMFTDMNKRRVLDNPEVDASKFPGYDQANRIRGGLKKGGRAGYQGGGRTNLLEELGRVEGESSNRNRRAEVSRIHGELNRGYKKGGRAGYKHGGAAKRGQGCEIKS